MHIYTCSFCQRGRKMNIDIAERMFPMPSRGELCAFGSPPSRILWEMDEHNACVLLSSWHLLLLLMHLYATLKGCGLMTGDHSLKL